MFKILLHGYIYNKNIIYKVGLQNAKGYIGISMCGDCCKRIILKYLSYIEIIINEQAKGDIIMGIERSKKRVPKPINFEILKGITITSTGAVNINVPLIVNHVNFFPSSFKLNIHQRVIYIDPVIVEKDEPADYILITHSHQDHFSMPDIRNLLK